MAVGSGALYPEGSVCGSRDEAVVPDCVLMRRPPPHRTIRTVTISAPRYIRRSTPPSRANPFRR